MTLVVSHRPRSRWSVRASERAAAATRRQNWRKIQAVHAACLRAGRPPLGESGPDKQETPGVGASEASVPTAIPRDGTHSGCSAKFAR